MAALPSHQRDVLSPLSRVDRGDPTISPTSSLRAISFRDDDARAADCRASFRLTRPSACVHAVAGSCPPPPAARHPVRRPARAVVLSGARLARSSARASAWFPAGPRRETPGPSPSRGRRPFGHVAGSSIHARVRAASGWPRQLPLELPPELPLVLSLELMLELPLELTPPLELPLEMMLELPLELSLDLLLDLPLVELPLELLLVLPLELPLELPPELPLELPFCRRSGAARLQYYFSQSTN